MDKGSDLRQRLRELTVLDGPFRPVDFDSPPATPQQMFLDWFEAAVGAGVPEPHAMTLSTVDPAGFPDARVLILKNIDERGWHFAISTASPKGRQLQEQPAVALTFYWQKLGRQVRIRGTAMPLSAAESAQDFLERSVSARANARLHRQSQELDSPSSIRSAMAESIARINEQPEAVEPAWQVYVVRPLQVEFWQGAADRMHERLLFLRGSDQVWKTTRLWP